MATLLILPIFFGPIGDCIYRVPLYYLFDEKKLIHGNWSKTSGPLNKKKSEEKGKKIYVFILQSKMEDGGNIIM